MTSRASAPLCRLLHTTVHPAVVEHMIAARTVEAALRDDARHTGSDQPGRDYRAEATVLAPILARVFVAPALLARLDPTSTTDRAA